MVGVQPYEERQFADAVRADRARGVERGRLKDRDADGGAVLGSGDEDVVVAEDEALRPAPDERAEGACRGRVGRVAEADGTARRGGAQHRAWVRGDCLRGPDRPDLLDVRRQAAHTRGQAVARRELVRAVLGTHEKL